MPLLVSGKEFFTATEVAQDVGVVRQTLWRWRRAGKIPSGHRFRDRQILFTRQEVNAIRSYANMVEPIADVDAPTITADLKV